MSDDPSIVEEEVVALVALIRKMAGRDRKYTVEEAGAIQAIATEVGSEVFWKLMDASYDAPPSPEETWELASTVTRPKAQKTILDALRKLATSDGIDPRELELFGRLGQLWNI